MGGSRLQAPYKNLLPDDLVELGSDDSTGDLLQVQIIFSRKVCLHRDHNKLLACRLISKSSVSGKWQLCKYFIIYYIVIIIGIMWKISVMCFNHPKTIPLSKSIQKLSPTKLFPGTKQVGDFWSEHSSKNKHPRKTKDISWEASVWFILTTIWSLIQPYHFSLLYRAYSNLPSLKISEIWISLEITLFLNHNLTQVLQIHAFPYFNWASLITDGSKFSWKEVRYTLKIIYFNFNWRLIAYRICGFFCAHQQESAIDRFTHVPSLKTSLPSPLHPTLQPVTEPLFRVLWAIQQVPLAI